MKSIYSIAFGIFLLCNHASPLQAASTHLSAVNPPKPQPAPPPPPKPKPKPQLDLGPLTDLAGNWVGTGFTLISLPDFSSVAPSTGPKDFRLLLNATTETIEFKPIKGAVVNRGVVSDLGSTTGQPDISLFGLTYMQQVNDFVTNESLHIEPGIWVKVPPTTVFPDNPNETVVRMATIPHGDSVLALSTFIATVPGPVITPISSIPFTTSGSLPAGFLDPFMHPSLPPGIKQSYVTNPNQLLLDTIAEQTIIKTVVLVISTNVPAGGILNIPFVIENANATQLDAIFWIETVQRADGSTFLQLQYTQTVMLNFLGINFPHITVATLVKK